MSTERRGDTVAEVKKYKVRYLEGGGTVKRIAVGLVVILEPDCLYKERGGRGRMARGGGGAGELGWEGNLYGVASQRLQQR